MHDHKEILAALDNFATPLALLSPAGETIHVNPSLTRRFGQAVIVPTRLGDDLDPGAAHPTQVAIQTDERGDVRTHALALRMQDHQLLILHDESSHALEAEVHELRQHVGQLRQVAATDHLTGAWNRAQFDRLIVAELARSENLAASVSLVLLDIDHFKRINDTHGHAAGDEVLRETVRVAQGALRKSDRLFRWGGEEFAVLLPDAGYRCAARVAETVRRSLAEHDFAGIGRVTVSAGVAERCPDEGLQSWFGRLDRALYQAKDAGRNRVVVDRAGLSDSPRLAHGGHALRLQWREAYECGDPVIDDQHVQLFVLANAVLTAASVGSAGLVTSLEELIAHVVRHFEDEESILESSGFPGLVAHRRAHGKLVAEAGRLHRAAAHGRARLGDLAEYVARQVITEHLLTFDRAFIPFLKGTAMY